MDRTAHWERVYETKRLDEVSWYDLHLATSLEWIREAAPERESAVIDVGGGASTLAEDLYAEGYRSLTVLDVSERAIAHVRTRMGKAADAIRWIAGDVTQVELPTAAFDVWHDRAVFHFLMEAEDREAYRRQLLKALRPGGEVILATFSLNGPERCSGLPVCRYDASALAAEFGRQFRVVKSATVQHHTPTGGTQEFLYCRMARVAS